MTSSMMSPAYLLTSNLDTRVRMGEQQQKPRAKTVIVEEELARFII